MVARANPQLTLKKNFRLTGKREYTIYIELHKIC